MPGSGRAVRHRLTAHGEQIRQQGVQIVDGVLTETIGVRFPAELAELHRLLRANH